MQIRPRRSVLYMPGSNQRALEKARTLDADCLILDLEDAVAPDVKETAREQVAAAVKAGGYGKRELAIRINSLDTPWGHADLQAAAKAGPGAILVPKIQSAADIMRVRGGLSAVEAPAVDLWTMIETPRCILNLNAIAAAASDPSYPVTCFILGTNDLLKEMRAAATRDRLPLITSLSLAVLAARGYGIDVVDGVYNDINDAAGFEAECAQGRALGMDGKTLIHPSQIAPCNAAFSPAEAEVAWAQKVLAAFELPENQGKGAIAVDGRMVELLHRDIAARTVALHEAVKTH
jgi:citrate lyase subunit beta / citryl-CoA lyase